MKIRRFSLSDYDETVSLWKKCGLKIRPGDSIGEIRLKVRRDPELFLVAEDNDKLVGTCVGAWDGRRGWIYHLGVLPSYQRKGIATALVKEVEKRMKRKGCVKVNAIIYKWNRKSRRFFEEMGYTADATTVIHGKMLKRA
jgi:ribosomal protein S18 acetylase RimI-like enzyme